jgi:hypothetical protein
MSDDNDVPVRSLILVPAIITLAVTLLRLVGELQGWSERFFSRAAGGQGAIVGIVWLVFVFGIYFGWKLAVLGYRPPGAWRAAGLPLLGLLLIVATALVLNKLKVPPLGQLLTFSVVSWIAVLIALRGWPALGRVLLAYAFAARIPVALVMLVAMLGNWGTHYDVAPPDFPAMSVWAKWFLIGVLPQLTGWIAFTVVLGTLFGLLGMVVARARGAEPATA